MKSSTMVLGLQIHARKERVRLYTMTGVDWTERYPWIVEDVARLNMTTQSLTRNAAVTTRTASPISIG